jgi:hypothetical protein
MKLKDEITFAAEVRKKQLVAGKLVGGGTNLIEL